MSLQQKPINIRTATPTDANAIASIHVAAWRAAYINIVPQYHLDNLNIDDRVKLWQRILSTPATASSILIAEDSNTKESRLLGFVSFGAVAAIPSPGDKVNNEEGKEGQEKTAELRAIYISPQHWTKGIGQALWKATQQQLLEEKFTSVVVKAFARNERAMRFYRAVGFEGEEMGVTEVGGESLETVKMRKGLA
ncbi:hypothetical protein KCV03_g968, partial [Aureobasidium melanogenum]